MLLLSGGANIDRPLQIGHLDAMLSGQHPVRGNHGASTTSYLHYSGSGIVLRGDGRAIRQRGGCSRSKNTAGTRNTQQACCSKDGYFPHTVILVLAISMFCK